MSEFAEFGFDAAPQLHFIDEVLGTHRLTPETIQLYHAEAVVAAARVCTAGIAEYYSGTLKYNRATSVPIPYRNGVLMGLGLSVGPRALWDENPVETVEIGLFTHQQRGLQFQSVAELRDDYVRTGGLVKPRMNDPQDLDSFMRGLRYIADQVV